MNDEQTRAPNRGPTWIILLVAVAALVLATAALTASVLGRSASDSGAAPSTWSGGRTVGGMMGSGGMMGGGYAVPTAPAAGPVGPGPGETGFIAGTPASPRVIRILAGPGYAFTPSTLTVARGETVTFEVTTMGPTIHEFMVGPADAVAADLDGTPEVADIGMMQTRSLTFTFDGTGPFAYACHADGHYEAGMRGTITIAG